jgi:hypothetical protein
MTPRDQLNALVALCGNYGNAGFLLGLSRATVRAFMYKQGRISVIGALLASKSVYLNHFFKRSQLRPDCRKADWIKYRKHPFYKAARAEQLKNEQSPICALLPVAVLLENICPTSKK